MFKGNDSHRLLVCLQDLLLAWTVADHQSVREAGNGKSDDAAKLFDPLFNPLLTQSEAVSPALEGPNTSEDKSEASENTLSGAIVNGGRRRVPLVSFIPVEWSRGGNFHPCPRSQIGKVRGNLLGAVLVNP